jgi:hypothetical protein
MFFESYAVKNIVHFSCCCRMHRRCVKTKPFKNSPMNMAEGNSFFRAKYTLNAATGGVSRVQRYRPQIILSKRSE